MRGPRSKTTSSAVRAEAVALLVMAVAGCGDSSTTTGPLDAGLDGSLGQDSGRTSEAGSSDATAPDGGSDSAAPDAGHPDSGGDAGSEGGSLDGGSDAGPLLTGSISFIQVAGTFSFYAIFQPAPSSTAGCTASTSGACTLTVCPSAPMPQPGANAGTISFSGGSIPAGAALPGPSYEYSTSGSLAAQGDTLSVSATGGTVPAFGPQSVVVPAAITLTAPTVGNPTLIPTSSDLAVAWTGGQNGATMAFGGGSNDGTTRFECTWTATAGQGTVPQAILAGLTGMSGQIGWEQYPTVTFTAGAYTISISAAVDQLSATSFQ
jgi:hypothetical protein